MPLARSNPDCQVFLANLGISHWGNRVELVGVEAHDTQRSVQVFGEAYVTKMLCICRTANTPVAPCLSSCKYSELAYFNSEVPILILAPIYTIGIVACPVAISLSPPHTHIHILTPTHSLVHTTFASLCLSTSLSRTVFLSLSLFLSLFLSLSLSLSVFLFLCLSFSVCLSLYRLLYFSVSQFGTVTMTWLLTGAVCWLRLA